MKLRVQFFKHESLGFISIVYIAKQNKKQKVFGFSKRNRGFSKFNGIRVFVEGKFFMSPTKFGPDRFNRFNVYCRNEQTDKQSDKQSKTKRKSLRSFSYT